ncbi:MAG: hypothetical protein B6I35_07105 [Anaerolineaceae bacterium 4572_32.2]|nr:MAG: hypothetical protein B6I35_07105 [Anaerolineaceae bacterium 4572_32.2]
MQDYIRRDVWNLASEGPLLRSKLLICRRDPRNYEGVDERQLFLFVLIQRLSGRRGGFVRVKQRFST